jgi:radical SAM-linked protein
VTEPGPSGPRPAAKPAVQHLLVRYAKRGKMRFASHRDVARVFERGVRRAGLPIAYSAGFTPHPKISYAGGAPTGVASEAEYLSLALTSRQAATQVCERLNAALPDGIDVIDVTEDAGGTARLEASEWRVVLPGVQPAAAERAVADFLALSEAPVERLTDKGVRRLDARTAVVEMDVLWYPAGRLPGIFPLLEGSACLQTPSTPRTPLGAPPGSPLADDGQRAVVTGLEDCAILRMVVLHTAPAVRPEDVLTALRARHGLVPSSPPMTTRLAQGSRTQLAGTSVLWRRCCGPGEASREDRDKGSVLSGPRGYRASPGPPSRPRPRLR